MTKDKQKRASERRAARAAKSARKRRRYALLNTAVAAALALAILLGASLLSGAYRRAVTVMTVGGDPLSAVGFNYYYRDCYDSFTSAYGDYIDSYGLIDPALDLDEQAYSRDCTWADFFYDTALQNAVRTEILYRKAVEAGCTLSEEDAAEIDGELSSIRQNASANGFFTAGQFLRSHYGGGASFASYRAYKTRAAVAAAYSSEVYNAVSYSEEQLAACGAESFAGAEYDYDTVSFREIMFAYELGSGDAAAGFSFTEESMEQAKAMAATCLAQYESGDRSEDSFAYLASGYSDNHAADGGLVETACRDDDEIAAEPKLAAWIYDGVRRAGDTAVLEGTYGTYVLYWVGNGPSARDYKADKALRTEAWNAWYDALAAATPFETSANIRAHLYYKA